MSILDNFADMKVDIVPISVTETSTASGIGRTKTPGATIKGVVFNVSAAKTYFSAMYGEDVTSVAVVDDITGIDNNGILRINGREYSIDSPEDPGMNNLSGFDNVYTIGLKVVK